jgi:hypothetical protein
MKRTVSRLFDSHDEAAAAVHDLETAGFDTKDVSLVSSDARRTAEARSFAPAEPGAEAAAELEEHSDSIHAAHGVAKGAAIGAGIGGGATLLAGAGLLAIPGMGPVLAAGFLTTALAGAATGAMTGTMLGALRDSGHSEEDAHALAEGLRRGGSIVTVRAPEDRASMAEEILVRHGGVDAAVRRKAYEAEGWKAFEEQPPGNPDLGA